MYDIAVVIGRFQPLHFGHEALLERALAVGREVVVLVGSAHQAPSPRNPFSFADRAAMLTASVPAPERHRLHLLPLRDYYDLARWARAAIRAVGGLSAAVPAVSDTGSGTDVGPAPAVVLVSHSKDVSADYRDIFPTWAHESVPALKLASGVFAATRAVAPEPPPVATRAAPQRSDASTEAPSGIRRIDASWVREQLFAAAPWLARGALTPEQALLPFETVCSPGVLRQLESWLGTEAFQRVAADARALRAYRDAWANAPYAPVFVTTDVLVTSGGHVLLVSRGKSPGRGLLALPGGFLEQGERLFASACREVHEETGLRLTAASARRCLRASHIFDHPQRSQRGRTITHVFHLALDAEAHQALATPPGGLPAVAAGDDAAEAWWCPKCHLVGLEDRFFEDHFIILDHFLSLLGLNA